jgi:N-acetylglucosaminyldiphosphoundecaprenol N-acetyl-beta-D-mannosaminyltransferase
MWTRSDASPLVPPFTWSRSRGMARVRLYGMEVDAVCEQDAVETILGWIEQPDGSSRYVVTPNVQHAAMFQHSPELRAAYEHASLVLVDGAPLVWTGRILGLELPERIAGSDLVPALFSASRRRAQPLSVFLLGAGPGVGERAAKRTAEQYPNLRVVGTYSPPSGFEHSERECHHILQLIEQAAPELLIVGFGAPKQELWTRRHRDRLRVPAVVCAGATIDFLAGARRRAPRWMRRAGLEWFFRMTHEPRRLGPRYFSDALRFPQLFLREWRSHRGSPGRR